MRMTKRIGILCVVTILIAMFAVVSAPTMAGCSYAVSTSGTSSYGTSGTSAYDSMNTELKQGLNMIGWLNCTKQITDLTSIDGKYGYATRWNALEQKFETYNPVAPNGFNDFTAMESGEWYFVSAKEVTTLSENC
jgi:hypothetical protein